MRIKEDILACTAAELNYGLAQFVKEITRPNGERYEPDSIYYLCLGIQQVRQPLVVASNGEGAGRLARELPLGPCKRAHVCSGKPLPLPHLGPLILIQTSSLKSNCLPHGVRPHVNVLGSPGDTVLIG